MVEKTKTMEDKIRELINEINRNAGDGCKRYDLYDYPDIVASKAGLRVFAAKLLAASLLDEEGEFEFNMEAEFSNLDYNDRVLIKVSDTYVPSYEPVESTKMENVQLILGGLIILFITGAGMIKIYEWVK